MDRSKQEAVANNFDQFCGAKSKVAKYKNGGYLVALGQLTRVFLSPYFRWQTGDNKEIATIL